MRWHRNWGWEAGLNLKPGSQSSIYWMFSYENLITQSLKTMISWSPAGAQTSCTYQHSPRSCRSKMVEVQQAYLHLRKAAPCPPKPKTSPFLCQRCFGNDNLPPALMWFLSRELKPSHKQCLILQGVKIKGKFLCPLPITPETHSSQNWETEETYL